MATFIPVPNTVEAHLRGTVNTKPVENTLYFHKSGSWDITSMGILNAALSLWYRTAIVPALAAEYVYRQSVLVDLTAADGLIQIDDSGAGLAGSAGPNVSSNQSAFCVRFTTDRRGRSYRGRNYIPGIAEGNVSASRLDSSLANAFVTAYEILQSYDGLFGAQWVVVSRYADKLPRAFGISTEVVSVSYSTLALATQRGRREV